MVTFGQRVRPLRVTGMLRARATSTSVRDGPASRYNTNACQARLLSPGSLSHGALFASNATGTICLTTGTFPHVTVYTAHQPAVNAIGPATVRLRCQR